MKIHKEGRTLLIFLFLLFAIINTIAFRTIDNRDVFFLILGICIILFILILQFFRNPNVIIPMDASNIYAPADGKIVAIEPVPENEFLPNPSIQISIFMSPLNVHVNRVPVSGKVKTFVYHKGKYLVAWHPKSSLENERTTMIIEMQNGVEILVRQIAGAVARRIKWYVDEGDDVIQGNEFGFIKFGSRVDVLIPQDYPIQARIGQKTRAGKTILSAIPG